MRNKILLLSGVFAIVLTLLTFRQISEYNQALLGIQEASAVQGCMGVNPEQYHYYCSNTFYCWYDDDCSSPYTMDYTTGPGEDCTYTTNPNSCQQNFCREYECVSGNYCFPKNNIYV